MFDLNLQESRYLKGEVDDAIDKIKDDESVTVIILQVLLIIFVISSLIYLYIRCWSSNVMARKTRYYDKYRNLSKVIDNLTSDDEAHAQTSLLSKNEALYQQAEIYTDGAFSYTNPLARLNDNQLSKSQGKLYRGYTSDSSIENGPAAEACLYESTMDQDTTVSSKARTTKEYSSRLKSDGVLVVIYASKGPKSAKLHVIHDEIRWTGVNESGHASAEGESSKQYKISLKDVVNVEYGKQTDNFQRSVAKSAKDSRCLSIISATKTLDLELPSKQERDFLATILTMKVDKYMAGRFNSL